MSTLEERNSVEKRRRFAALLRPHRNHRNQKQLVSHSRKTGSAGYDKELEFYNLLSCNKYIKSYNWLSEHEKTNFDFEIVCDGGHLLIDVTGYSINNGRIQLNTSHKNIPQLLKYAKDKHAKACYLAFPNSDIDMSDIKTWRFLRLRDDMPSGNIYISKSRGCGLMTADHLFRDKRSRKTIMHERLLHKYAPREERWNELEKWIYGDSPTVAE